MRQFLPLEAAFVDEVRLRDILHHTTALRLKTDDEVGRVYSAADIVRLVGEARLVDVPGVRLRYSNLAVNLVNPLVRESTSLSLKEYAQKVLFEPLDISNIYWLSDREGNQFMLAGLHLKLGDIAKIGGLLLSGGRFKERQVIPESWIESLWRPSRMVHQDAIGGRVSWSNLWAQTCDEEPAIQRNLTFPCIHLTA